MNYKKVKFDDVSLKTFEQFQNIKVVVFDFDGTLYKDIDWTGFSEFFIDSIREMFPQLTKNQFEDMLARHNVSSESVMEDIARVFKLEKNSTKQFVDFLDTIKFEGNFTKAKAFPKRLLEDLSQNYRLFILSNSSGPNIQFVSQKINLNLTPFEKILSNRFEVDDLSKTKKLKELLIELNISPNQVLMVGDSIENDLNPARNLGMQTLLMLD